MAGREASSLCGKVRPRFPGAARQAGARQAYSRLRRSRRWWTGAQPT